MSLKVRIGISLGGYGDATRYSASVDRLEEVGVDSLWLPELVFGSLVEPFIGMAHALARTSRLKVGTGVTILPGRHPVLVAKQLASLAALSPAGCCPRSACSPPAPRNGPSSRSRPAGARPCSTNRWNCCGCCCARRMSRSPASTSPSKGPVSGRCPPSPSTSGPVAVPPVRCGGPAGWPTGGWGASSRPREARVARETIQAAAAEAGREIEDDHFGLSLAVATGPNGRDAGLAARVGPAAAAGCRSGDVVRHGVGGRSGRNRAVRGRRAEQVRGPPGRRGYLARQGWTSSWITSSPK